MHVHQDVDRAESLLSCVAALRHRAGADVVAALRAVHDVTVHDVGDVVGVQPRGLQLHRRLGDLYLDAGRVALVGENVCANGFS
ncbi:hypothetical protein ACVWWN_002114 [Mycobacterium sp. URHB0021]